MNIEFEKLSRAARSVVIADLKRRHLREIVDEVASEYVADYNWRCSSCIRYVSLVLGHDPEGVPRLRGDGTCSEPDHQIRLDKYKEALAAQRKGSYG